MVYWFRQKAHDLEVVGSNPHCGDHFHALGPQSMGAKIDWKIPGIVAYAVILQKGGWTWRTVGF